MRRRPFPTWWVPAEAVAVTRARAGARQRAVALLEVAERAQRVLALGVEGPLAGAAAHGAAQLREALEVRVEQRAQVGGSGRIRGEQIDPLAGIAGEVVVGVAEARSVAGPHELARAQAHRGARGLHRLPPPRAQA